MRQDVSSTVAICSQLQDDAFYVLLVLTWKHVLPAQTSHKQFFFGASFVISVRNIVFTPIFSSRLAVLIYGPKNCFRFLKARVERSEKNKIIYGQFITVAYKATNIVLKTKSTDELNQN